MSSQKQPEGAAARAPREAQGEQLSATVSVPAKLVYHIVGDRGFFFRNLRNAGVIVESPPTPAKPETPTPTKKSNGASNGRIDIDEDEQTSDVDYIFEIFPRYAGQGDETVEWTLKSRNQAALDKAQKTVADAIKTAEAASHIGVLAGLPQSAFARIVGTKGATVSRLRAESGTDIFIPRDDSNVVEITGSKEDVEAAKDLIIEIVSRPSFSR